MTMVLGSCKVLQGLKDALDVPPVPRIHGRGHYEATAVLSQFDEQYGRNHNIVSCALGRPFGSYP